MFESGFLERFSRAHPLTPAVLYVPFFGRRLRGQHLLHHFKEPTTRFRVSCPGSTICSRTASTRTAQ
jgi:hypothetical protein